MMQLALANLKIIYRFTEPDFPFNERNERRSSQRIEFFGQISS
jgi:hypothetical protein